MVQLGDLNVSGDHPLASELSSLRTAVARFQDEAHDSSVKLQRHSLGITSAHEQIAHLERENDLLKSELAILRANSHQDALLQAHPAALQVQQLTLSLRRLSDKLSLTEEDLLTRTTELAHSKSEVFKVKLAAEGAYELAARIRAREEAGKLREMELEWKVKTTEEDVKMSDLVVKEYADLVRSLEAKAGMRSILRSPSEYLSQMQSDKSIMASATASSSSNMLTPADSLSEGKSSLRRLHAEFSAVTENLQAEIIRAHGELATSEAKREAESKGAEQDRIQLAKARFELNMLKLDDNAAAKMVSRYMKFSQTSTDALQMVITNLKARYAATVDSLAAQLSDLFSQLHSSEAREERLRDALDELGGDLMKETYGRRREVALRIRMVSREQRLQEELERWILRTEEAFERGTDDRVATERMVQDARVLLSATLDGSSVSSFPSSGTLSRVVVAENAVSVLVRELERETNRRLELESLLVRGGTTFSNDDNDATIEDGGGFQSAEVLVTPVSSAAMEESAARPASPKYPSLKLASDQSTPISTLILANAPTSRLTSDAESWKNSNDISTPPSLNRVGETSQVDLILETPILDVGGEASVTLDLQAPQFIVPSADQPSQVDLVNVHGYSPTLSGPADTQTTWTVDSSAPVSAPLSPQTQAVIELPTPIQDIRSIFHVDQVLKPPHLLMKDLIKVEHRYDDLQRAFRDCHIALETLKNNMSSAYSSPELPTPNNLPPPPQASREVIQTALERLNDYIEDARVELEIRVADEILMARGFEALLSVPGALSSSAPLQNGHGYLGAHESIPSQSEVELQAEAFMSGTDPTVQKARQHLTRKLDDIQHDIAALKLAVHNTVLSPLELSTAPAASSWTSWIRGSTSQTLSPSSGVGLEPGPLPIFGNVMTSARFGHSPSSNFHHLKSDTKDPFASLGLRVPMPSYVHVTQPQRSRTVSTMYMLGLGLGAKKPGGSFASSMKQPTQGLEDKGIDADEDEDDHDDELDVE